MDELVYVSAATLAAGIRSGQLSAVDVVDAVLERIRTSSLNAYTIVAQQEARRTAEAVDAAVRDGDSHAATKPLLGVPVSVKDNIETAGLRTTYGSRVFADNVPTEDAVVVARLKDAGAVIIGKTSLPEFATKGVVDSPLDGVTRNPWNTERVVGGSSGGAAAAVAAGLGPLAIGNDQAGSVRMPAALCGVVGLKPTGGRIPFAPNPYPWDQLFHIGAIARTVEDVELALRVLEGMHPADPLSVPAMDTWELPVPHQSARVAWSPRVGFGRIEPDVLTVVEAALETVATFAEVEPSDLDLGAAHEAYSVLVPFKRAVEIGHRLQDWEPLMDPEVVAYIRGGLNMGVDHVRAGMAARTHVYHEVERVLATHDFIVTPTLSVTAFEIGRTGPETIDGRATESFRDWFPYTYPFNLTGHPAITLPAGWSHGLPVGIQIVGRRYADRAVLAFARELERRRPWVDAVPPVW